MTIQFIYSKIIYMETIKKDLQIFKFDDNLPPEQSIDTKVKKLVFDDLHEHEYVEIFYVISGSGQHWLNGEVSPTKAGDVYIILPGDTHRHIKSKTSSDFLYRDILIKLPYFKIICETYYKTLYNDFFNKYIPQSISLPTTSLFLFENIFLQYSNTPKQEKLILERLIVHNLIISFLNNNTLKQSKKLPNWMITFISELNRPANFTVPLKELVNRFHYTSSYMCKSFKKHTGSTITDYFNNNRIAYADSLLKTTNYSIEYICSICGFNNPSYFYSLYKKNYKTTPRKFSTQPKKPEKP